MKAPLSRQIDTNFRPLLAPGLFFGFLPMRTRWRDDEYSGPTVLDVDLLIELHLSEPAPNSRRRALVRDPILAC